VLLDALYDRQTDQVAYWVRAADSFSAFVFDWFAHFYFAEGTPLSASRDDDRGLLRSQGEEPYRSFIFERDLPPEAPPLRSPAEKPYRDGLWLYAPDAEPLAPPHLQGERIKPSPGS
jgi:hypothetical protein